MYIPTRAYHDYVYKDIGKGKLNKASWISQQGVAQVMDYLIEKDSNYSKTKDLNPKYATVFGSIKKQLDNDRPVVGIFLKYKYYLPDTNKFFKAADVSEVHSVVIYGYRETGDGLYYLCHMGWGGQRYTNAWISSIGLGRYGYSFIDVNDKSMKA